MAKKTKVAVIAGHDNFHMHGACKYGVCENGFWSYFIWSQLDVWRRNKNLDVKVFRRPNQRQMGYHKAMRMLHHEIDEWGASIDIEMHFNAAPMAKGYEVLRYRKSSRGLKYAKMMDASFDKFLTTRDRGVKSVGHGERGSYGLYVGKSASIITEAFFAKEIANYEEGGRSRERLEKAYVDFFQKLNKQ